MDFKTAANTVLGYDLVGSLVNLNVDALQGLLFSIIRKLSEFSAKTERLEYELDSKTSKAELFSLREKINSLPSQEEFAELAKIIDSKADKEDIEIAFDSLQDIKDKITKLDSGMKTKATKQELELIHSQISYLQETVGNQEQEVTNVRQLRQQINNLANPDQTPVVVQEKPADPGINEDAHRATESKINDLKAHIDYLQDKLDEMETNIANQLAAMAQMSGTGVEEKEAVRRSLDSIFEDDEEKKKKRMEKIEEKRKVQHIPSGPAVVDDSVIETKVNQLLLDHPLLRRINSTIDNTHQLFENQKKEVERISHLVDVQLNLSSQQEDVLQKTSAKVMDILESAVAKTKETSPTEDKKKGKKTKPTGETALKKQELEALKHSFGEMAASIESKTNNAVIVRQEKRMQELEEALKELRENQSKIALEKIKITESNLNLEEVLDAMALDERFVGLALPKAGKGETEADLRGEIERLSRRMYSTREELAVLQKDFIQLQQNQNSSANGPRNSEDPDKLEPQRASRLGSRPLLSRGSQLNVVRSQSQVTESLESHSKDIRTLFGAVKELSEILEEKANTRNFHELEDWKDGIREELLQIRAQMEQKADKLENLHLTQELKKMSTNFQDLKDESVLRGVIEDLTNNIRILFETKADAQAVQKVLAEKGDLKVLATKANRSYCEALVERVNHSLNSVSNKLDNFINVTGTEMTNKLNQIKRSIQIKADRTEIQQLIHAYSREHFASMLEPAEGSVSRKQPPLYCLSCDRPITKVSTNPNTPTIPLLPSTQASIHTRGSYDAEYYRKERKKRSVSPTNGHRLAQQFRKHLKESQHKMDEDAEREDHFLKLPALPISPPAGKSIFKTPITDMLTSDEENQDSDTQLEETKEEKKKKILPLEKKEKVPPINFEDSVSGTKLSIATDKDQPKLSQRKSAVRSARKKNDPEMNSPKSVSFRDSAETKESLESSEKKERVSDTNTTNNSNNNNEEIQTNEQEKPVAQEGEGEHQDDKEDVVVAEPTEQVTSPVVSSPKTSEQ